MLVAVKLTRSSGSARSMPCSHLKGGSDWFSHSQSQPLTLDAHAQPNSQLMPHPSNSHLGMVAPLDVYTPRVVRRLKARQQQHAPEAAFGRHSWQSSSAFHATKRPRSRRSSASRSASSNSDIQARTMVGQTALRSFDLKSGGAKGTYPFPTNGGVCNSMAVASRHRVRHRVVRQPRPQATARLSRPRRMDHRSAARCHRRYHAASDGAVYVNTFMRGQLFRIPVNPDGSAGTMVRIDVHAAESAGWVANGGSSDADPGGGPGTRDRTDNQGNHAEVRVLQEGLTAASGVTVVGSAAFVLVERAKAVAVSYRPQ